MSSILDMLSLKGLLEKYVHIYVYMPTYIIMFITSVKYFKYTHLWLAFFLVDIFPYQDI